jgi:hypothetical protein
VVVVVVIWRRGSDGGGVGGVRRGSGELDGRGGLPGDCALCARWESKLLKQGFSRPVSQWVMDDTYIELASPKFDTITRFIDL